MFGGLSVHVPAVLGAPAMEPDMPPVLSEPALPDAPSTEQTVIPPKSVDELRAAGAIFVLEYGRS